MLIYIIALFASMFFAVLYQKKQKWPITKNTNRTVWAVASAVPLTAVSAIRFEVGTDYFFAYLKNYYASDGVVSFETAFWALYKFLQMFQAHYQWIFIISSTLISFFVFTAIYQQSSNPALSVFLYVTSTYYFIGMNAVRQFCAMSVCLYGLKYLAQKKDWWKYIVCVIIGTMFHTTAFVMIIMLIVNVIPINRISISLYAALLGIVHFSMPWLIALLVKVPYYGGYIGSAFDEQTFETTWFLISLAVVMFSLLFYKSVQDNKFANIHIKAMLISLGVLTFSASIPLTKRIAWYFAFSQIILIPLIIEKIPQRSVCRFFKVCIIGSYTVMCLLGIGYQNAQECLPYKTFFSHSEQEVQMECEIRYGRKKESDQDSRNHPYNIVSAYMEQDVG